MPCLSVCSAGGAESIIVSVPPAESMILSALFYCVITLTCYQQRGRGQKKTTIGDTDDCRLVALVNSASTAPPIGLPLKGAEVYHTSNRLLVGHQCRLALSQL
jgi:hypothetical protein